MFAAAQRYAGGLALAIAVCAVTFAMGLAVVSPWERAHPSGLVGIAVLFAVLGSVVIAGVIGPVVLLARRLSGDRLKPRAAAVIGALLSPLCLLLIWLLFRERNETLGGLIRFWMRLPGEFAVGVIPHALAAALFSVWITSASSTSSRARASSTPRTSS